MTPRRPYVSDHAMLRYLERVIGIDVETHRHDVEARVARAVELGACALVSGGMRYALDDFRVVTVRPATSEPRYPRGQFPGDDE